MTSLDLSFDLYPKQMLALTTSAQLTLYGGAAGGGKACSLNTTIATPTGFKTFGEIQVGDEIFHPDGSTQIVTHLHPINYQPKSYRLTFDNGQEIECCADHLWHTYTATKLAALTRLDPQWREKRRNNRKSRGTGKRPDLALRNSQQQYDYKSPPTGSVKSTQQIYETLRLKSGRANHAIPVTKSIDLPAIDLPLDPYCLGAWLGDGSKGCGQITGLDPEVWEQFEIAGFKVTHSKIPHIHYAHKLITTLKNMGVAYDKHVPTYYLRASVVQRLALLQGLMDTDGTCDKDGSVQFTNTNENLADGVYELVSSLGWKAFKTSKIPTLKGKPCARAYNIKFSPDKIVFRIKRKADRQKLVRRRTNDFHYIVDCKPIDPIPMRCITVSRDDGLFLISKSFIPTHNSHLARIAAIYAALQYPGMQVYLFRRHYNDLVLNHMNGPTGFRELLFDLTQQGLCKIVDDQIRFYNGRNKTLGSTIHLCHCQYDSDVEKYRGAEIHYFIPEETTQFSETQLRFLLSRVRIPDTLPIPANERHKWPRILMPTNPGGLCHSYIKSNYIDGKKELEIWNQAENDGGRTCIFIPAKLSDNPSIDPVQYRMALMGLKRPELIDAMLNGSWDIPLGAFFPEADERIHRIKPFDIPKHWFKFRTYDWGSGAPFCVQWWTVSDGTIPHLPRGALICYREWYGCSSSDTKIGLGLSNSQVVEGILDRTPKDEIIQATITDSKPFQATGMTSKVDLGSTPAKEFASLGVPLQRGIVNPGSRILGWQQLRSRLIDKMIFFLDNCHHTWRTLTEIQVDPKNIEDCDSSQEDHPVDCIGLAVKAQPLIKDLPKKNEPKFITEAKFDDVINMHLKLKRMRDNGAGR